MQVDLNIAFLFIGLVNGALIGSLLLYRRINRLANTVLAGFILVLVCRVLVYILGSSGVYDPHSWLYIPPIELSMAYGPLIYLYLTALTKSKLPSMWMLHFLPVVAQLLYYSVLMAMPSSQIIDWILNQHTGFIGYAESLLVSISMLAYLAYSWHIFFSYQSWLDNHVSDKENYRLSWLMAFLVMVSLSVVVWLAFLLMNFWVQFNYHSHFILFASQSMLLFYLALESWRYSNLVLPQMLFLKPPEEEVSDLADEGKYKQQAEQWLRLIEDKQWWRNPNINLAGLSNLLGTNTSTLSVVLNKGLDENFNSIINRIRTQFVCEEILSGVVEGELLKVAFSAGFNSKNSFNRNFKRFTGLTPTEYRQQESVKS